MPTNFCTSCGEKLGETKKFCPNCGKQLETTEETLSEADIIAKKYNITGKNIQKKKSSSPGSGCIWVFLILVALCLLFALLSDPDSKQESRTGFNELVCQTSKGCRPEVSSWDGSILCVKEWIKNKMNDPDSFESVKWGLPVAMADYWEIKVRYRGKNAFGGKVLEEKTIRFRMSKKNDYDCAVLGIE